VTDQHPELPLDPDRAGAGATPPPAARPRPAHHRPGLLAAVVAGGLVGAPARYLVSLALPTPRDGWPAATLIVNLAGAFVLGLLLEGLARSGPDAGWRRVVRLAAGTGFCGALTTYSTLAVEIDLLARHSRSGTALAYAVVSVVGGLVVTAAGIALAAAAHRAGRAGSPR
jgi:fluoride exporter